MCQTHEKYLGLRWELYDVDFSQSLQTLWAVTLIFLTCVRKSLLPGKYADLPGVIFLRGVPFHSNPSRVTILSWQNNFYKFFFIYLIFTCLHDTQPHMCATHTVQHTLSLHTAMHHFVVQYHSKKCHGI